MESIGEKIIDLDKPVVLFAQRNVTTLKKEQTVGEAVRYLCGRELAEKIVYFYVVDRENKLVGVVPVRRLLMSRPDVSITDIMVTDIVAMRDSATLREASEMLLGRRLMALPIVDDKGRLLGVVDITVFSGDTLGLAQRHEIDNVFQMIGVHVTLGRSVSPWSSFRSRFPWLLCNIGGGIVCAFIAARYEAYLGLMALLALFIPVVLAVSESVSMQSMTLSLQSLPYSGHTWRLLPKFLRREFLPALLLGLSSGILVGGIAYIWKGEAWLGGAIGISIALAILTACIFGVVITGAVKAFRADLKIATGPIILALADIVTLLFFFNIALWLQK